MSPRRATIYNKRDKNEKEIVNALASFGIEWHEGAPLDGWIYLGGWIPVEVKTKTGTLTQGQREFVAWCREMNAPVMVVRSVDDILDHVNAYRATLQ